MLAVRVKTFLTLNFGTTVDKLYLCIEHGDYFTVYAGSLEQARQYALGWGGEAIRELNENEL